MLNVCFCIGSLGAGGAERVVSLLSNYFFELGHSVHIIEVSITCSAPFYDISKCIEITNINKDLRKKRLFKRVQNLRKEFKRIKPDVVISFLSHVCVLSFFASRGLKTKFIACERNNPYTMPKNKVLRFLRNYVFKRADGCVFQTQDARDYFGKSIKQPIIIENPVKLLCEPKNMSPSVFSADLRNVVLVGSDKPEKNREMAYRSFSIVHKLYPNCILNIYGADSEKKDTETLINLGIKNHVVFHGNVVDWHKKVDLSSIFVLPSDFEGFPNALLEAASLRIPCISTDCPVGGPKQILRSGERGFLVKCGDYEDMANKIIELLSNNKTVENFYCSNEKTYLEYSLPVIGNKWIDYIHSICKKR